MKSKFNKLEFGRKGPDGVIGEGVTGWGGLGDSSSYDEITREMVKQADEINAILESIDLGDEKELSKNKESLEEGDSNKEDKELSRETDSETSKKIEELKKNLDKIFGER